MVNVSCGVQCKIAISFLIGAVHFFQPSRLFLRYARHLRLVGVEGGKRLFRRPLAGDLTEKIHETFDFSKRLMPTQGATGTHALSEIEPQFGMWLLGHAKCIFSTP